MKLLAWACLVTALDLALALSPAEKALEEAVRANDLADAQAALDQGADPNARYVISPLTKAAADGDAEMVRLLLKRGADPDRASDSVQGNSSALLRAADNGHNEVVSLLLEAGADPNASNRGITPLMAGAQYPEIVQKLLAAGADPELSDSAGTLGATALHYAVGSPESLKILLSETDPGGALGFHVPYLKGYLDQLAMRYYPRGWRIGPLLVAVWAGESASAQLLLEDGETLLNLIDKLGYELDPTGIDPLMAAAGTVWDDEVAGREILVRIADDTYGGRAPGQVNQVYLDWQDFWWHDNALTYALEAGRVEWARDLIERGLDPAHRDILDRDLLVRALDDQIPPRLADMRGVNLPRVNKPELAKFLIAQGVSPEPERLAGQPLWSNHLLAAIQDQDSELVTTLIQGGAELDWGSFDGKTPLIHAVENKDLGLVQALIQRGASLDAPDHAGKTALIYATQNQDLDLAKALLAAGAKPDRVDLEDKTALDYAQELGNQELVEILKGTTPD